MLFIAALFLIIARFLSVWSGTPFPINLVTSDSMQPTLFEGDVVAWTPTNIEDVEVGDVIVFKSYISWPDEKIVVHRVSNITEKSDGRILLETKGDKNKWTDQAGPHIPEPYIRENNLMGKVISAGQVPLKVPFVGIIGLWINDGLEAISQPTSAKESLNYAGVFAPLAISAIILVILIFILPEQANTFKEKIRMLIFGPKPLNIKKTAALFLIAYIVFLAIIHAFAFDSQTAAVGINAEGDKTAAINFGRIKPGTESFPKNMNIINPSTMPVKGIVFGNGNITDHVSKNTFSLDSGEVNSSKLNAYALNSTASGLYDGKIMVYSSPFWLMFPDPFVEMLLDWNGEATVYILDLLSAIILTALTMLLLIGITFFSEKITSLAIDSSWSHYPRLVLKKKYVKKMISIKNSGKKAVKNSLGWVLDIEYSKPEGKETFFTSYGKPIIASLVLLPFLFITNDPIIAMMLSIVSGGIIAYSISCKIRKKIVLTTLIIMIISSSYMVIQSNFIILEQQKDMMEMLSLSVVATGVYLLIVSFLLIPFAAISWAVTRYIRNVKEQKDPLLALEGTCDL